MIPLSAAVLFSAAAANAQETYMDSTNRVTLSLRFGLNIRANFRGFGSGLYYVPGSSPGNGRLTPVGDPYNYGDGYVYPTLNETTIFGVSGYYGFDNEAQVNTSQAQALGIPQSVSFDRSTATGISSDASSGGDKPYPGFELAYDRELGKKENWHDLRYGIEGAVNYMKLSMNDNSSSGATVTTVTTIYPYPAGTTAPISPVQGYPGDHFINQIGIPPSQGGLYPTTTLPATTSPGTFSSLDQFDGDLWGFRLGPYLEFPMSQKWSLHLSGGLALGLLDDNESWRQTINISGIGSSTASGQDSDFRMLWGYYASFDAAYQFSRRWGVEGGLQFQDLGEYDHSFKGREVALDLSRSLYVELGISYSF